MEKFTVELDEFNDFLEPHISFLSPEDYVDFLKELKGEIEFKIAQLTTGSEEEQ